MAGLSFDRYRTEIVPQTEQLVSQVDGADLATPVPTCPGWDLGRLLHHVGAGHRWVEEVVRSRAVEPLPDDALRVEPDEHPADHGTWLVEGALDEWMELGALPEMVELHPERRELLGPGRTLHLHATDTDDAEWVVDLTGDRVAWRRAHEKSAVAVRGPVVDLLLTAYGRQAPRDVVGDRALLDFWLERVSFG